ncbi:hypothetical protein [Haloechinothrix salitolerans]|uniref:Uncharacterized protein n=1 Tax=Haloechinothrix salitolerans TaxID=926830 RepID=A0ABW2C4C6_9PSEU
MRIIQCNMCQLDLAIADPDFPGGYSVTELLSGLQSDGARIGGEDGSEVDACPKCVHGG